MDILINLSNVTCMGCSFFLLSAMISYNVIIGDTITKIVIRVGGGELYYKMQL